MATSVVSQLAPPSKYTLMASMNMGLGTAQIRRNIGLFSANYPSASAITDLYLELQPGESFTGTATNAMFIHTSGTVTVVGTRPTPLQPLTYSVNRMSFTDEEFTEFEIMNQTVVVQRIHVLYAAPVPGTTTITQPAVTSVNGVGPDASGNVVIDTGVMTVNSITPDAQGDVNVTDEGIYNP